MKPGTIIRRAATPRPIGFNVGLHLGPARRDAVRRALDRKVVCVWQPGYRRNSEARYKFDPRRLDGLTAGAGRLEASAFLWLNFCRYRLIQTLAELEDRPLGHGLAGRIADWSLAADDVRDALLVCNRGLAYQAAWAAKPDQNDEEDIKQQAIIDLAYALDSFDVTRGTRFATYGYLAVVRKTFRAQRKIAFHIIRQGHSYEDDRLARTRVVNEPNSLEWSRERLALSRLIADGRLGLTRREEMVLIQRFGFNGLGRPQTLAAVGDTLRVSKETIRKVQNSALAKVEAALGLEIATTASA